MHLGYSWTNESFLGEEGRIVGWYAATSTATADRRTNNGNSYVKEQSMAENSSAAVSGRRPE